MDNIIINDQEKSFNNSVGVLTKIVKIMDFLTQNEKGDLNSISKGTRIPRSTTHRLLSALEGHHLITKTADGYVIGSRITVWSDASFSKSIVEAARPILKKLTESTNESSQIYIREGANRVCVASVINSSGLTNTVPVGSIFPIEVGSAGRVFKIWGEELLNKQYDAIRSQGWVESVAEREEGVASVSAPVFSFNGKLIAAISVSGPISRLGEKPSEKLASYVVEAAQELSGKL
ncbi:IclR family transcriptional regulator [Calidifontibacillus erzurumensis]|uniref:IclR family transcriptional regulator n=1 Tax=Calidifontibacillus erzurumensis TaxID=2741433 RepID=A0A8J8K9G8_9BACI|nr:IclR family transcriptional regulator [Calidifontibacillus erzurumensis]NSL53151.1 IclR family transcriptional regulator [Calidifontibacillus erzurumensis]